jgi:hypothetical protein
MAAPSHTARLLEDVPDDFTGVEIVEFWPFVEGFLEPASYYLD